MENVRFKVDMTEHEATELQKQLKNTLGDLYNVALETVHVASLSGVMEKRHYVNIVKIDNAIKQFVKGLFDSGMTLDEIIETVASVAITEDFKRGIKNESK